MLKINVTSNFKAVSKAIGAIGKQARFAAAVALTRTAQDLQRQIPAELDKVLDNPTPFTKRGTYLVAAKRDNLRSEVGFRPVQARYMALQIEGGTVQPGSAGIKLPGNIQLNAFGNIPRGTIARLKAAAKGGGLGLSAAITRRLAREIDSSSDAGGTAYQRLNLHGNRRKGAAPIQLFYGQPTGSGWEDAPVGIWRRIPPTTPGGKGKLVPVIVFEDRPARYRQRFNFRDLADRTVAARFPAHFQAELRKALATAR